MLTGRLFQALNWCCSAKRSHGRNRQHTWSRDVSWDKTGLTVVACPAFTVVNTGWPRKSAIETCPRKGPVHIWFCWVCGLCGGYDLKCHDTGGISLVWLTVTDRVMYGRVPNTTRQTRPIKSLEYIAVQGKKLRPRISWIRFRTFLMPVIISRCDFNVYTLWFQRIYAVISTYIRCDFNVYHSWNTDHASAGGW